MDMQVKIGDRIKKLRKRDGRKQEDLAKALGVTAQAVSRWESDGCYPDMSMLPAIANYFHVSIDFLFGYDNDREIRIRELTKKYNEARIGMGVDLDPDTLIDELRNSLEEFPGEPEFLRLLALSLADKGRDDPEKPNKYLKEAAEIYEGLLKESNGYIDGLLDVYTLLGDYEKAEKKAAEQPSVHKSSEILLATIEFKKAFYEGSKERKYAGEAILALLTELYFVITHALGNSEGQGDEKDALKISDALKGLFEAVFDGDYKEIHSYMCLLNLDCATFCAQMKEYDRALLYFDEAYGHFAEFMDVMRNGSETQFRSLLLERTDAAHVFFPYLNVKVFDHFLNKLPKNKKNRIMKDPKYRSLIQNPC